MRKSFPQGSCPHCPVGAHRGRCAQLLLRLLSANGPQPACDRRRCPRLKGQIPPPTTGLWGTVSVPQVRAYRHLSGPCPVEGHAAPWYLLLGTSICFCGGRGLESRGAPFSGHQPVVWKLYRQNNCSGGMGRFGIPTIRDFLPWPISKRRDSFSSLDPDSDFSSPAGKGRTMI